MTMTEVMDKLMAEYWQETGDSENYSTVRKYMQRALVVGMEHFDPSMSEIVALNQWGIEVGRYKSTIDASKKIGVCRQCIVKVINGRAVTAGGLKFVKAKDYDLKNTLLPKPNDSSQSDTMKIV